jgi:predicted nucleic acid-binding protein
MIAADTSSLAAYLQGEAGSDAEQIDDALAAHALALPPVVVTEILSDPANAEITESRIRDMPVLDPTDGYWERAGALRRSLRARGFKAKLGDALIAQSCIDHDVALITRDRDFRAFAKHCGLKLA